MDTICDQLGRCRDAIIKVGLDHPEHPALDAAWLLATGAHNQARRLRIRMKSEGAASDGDALLLPCNARVASEMLPEALTYLGHCGAKVSSIHAEYNGVYRVQFQHQSFGGDVQLICKRDAERGTFQVAIEGLVDSTASAIEARSDATPKSDAAEGESAVPNGETPS